MCSFHIYDSDVLCLITFDDGEQYDIDDYVFAVDLPDVNQASLIAEAQAADRYTYTSVLSEDCYEDLPHHLNP